MRQTIDLTWGEVITRLHETEKVQRGGLVYGVPNGGMILTSYLGTLKSTPSVAGADIILDDIEGSGTTKEFYQEKYPTAKFVSLYQASDFGGKWVTFPWEREHPKGGKTVQGNIVRLLHFIGEDPKRDGLKNTPDRVIKSYQELFSGYGKDPKSLFTTFENDGYDSMVLLKDIELYSMCEHHMLPFYGKAHVAYIPNHGKIVGISKLARLVDLFSRRLQVQERICERVTETLMEALVPKGAACIIEAVHMCMCARGVGKQNSVMVTSSLKGEFLTDSTVRQELMNLI